MFDAENIADIVQEVVLKVIFVRDIRKGLFYIVAHAEPLSLRKIHRLILRCYSKIIIVLNFIWIALLHSLKICVEVEQLFNHFLVESKSLDKLYQNSRENHQNWRQASNGLHSLHKGKSCSLVYVYIFIKEQHNRDPRGFRMIWNVPSRGLIVQTSGCIAHILRIDWAKKPIIL